jgi:hypothetical protein
MTDQAIVDRGLDDLNRIVVVMHTPVAFPRLHPDTIHVGIEFAGTICPDATAWPIAHLLRAIHRTRQSGVRDDTLTATLRIEKKTLGQLFDANEWTVQAFVADPSEYRNSAEQQPLESSVQPDQPARVSHRPLSHPVHDG